MSENISEIFKASLCVNPPLIQHSSISLRTQSYDHSPPWTAQTVHLNTSSVCVKLDSALALIWSSASVCTSALQCQCERMKWNELLPVEVPVVAVRHLDPSSLLKVIDQHRFLHVRHPLHLPSHHTHTHTHTPEKHTPPPSALNTHSSSITVRLLMGFGWTNIIKQK